MEENYSIIHFKEHHLNQVKKLYEESYNRKKPVNYFRYRYLSSPFGKPIVLLMKYKKKIIGLYAIHPVKLQIENKSVLGGYSFLTMTHPDHVGKGIFTSLAKKTFDLAKKKKYNFIYGFANSNSYYGFVNKLGFTELKPINFIKLSNIKLTKETRIENKSKNISHSVTKLWNQYNSKKLFKIMTKRDSKYIDWRYNKHPTFKYQIFYKKNHHFFIFKKHENILHIMDFFGNETNEFYKDLILTALSIKKKESCKEITFWIPKNHPIQKEIKKYNPKLIESKSHFIIKILNKKYASDLKEISNWYYTMGDADIF